MQEQWKTADEGTKNEKMGLNNKICENPAYWCKSHRIWLSEDDVKLKNCKEKPTMDMIGKNRCNSLVPVEEVPMYKRVYNK